MSTTQPSNRHKPVESANLEASIINNAKRIDRNLQTYVPIDTLMLK